MKPVCSIVIRAYNEERHIGRLLTGIFQQTIQDVQVILVDSGSTDATAAIASQYPVDIVHIRPEEFTFGKSLNMGIAEAKADLVVIASAHVFPVYPDWLERMLEPFKDPQVALAYGKQRGAPVTEFSEHQIFYHWFPETSCARQDHPFCNNANSAIRRTLWENHPYDELIPALEDLSWAQWVHDQGYTLSYVAEAEIIHVHEQNLKGIFNRYRREGMAFKQIYPQETFGLRDLGRLWFGNVISDQRAAREQKVWRREIKNILAFRWMQFYGTYQGYRQSGSLSWRLKQSFYYPNVNSVSLKNGDRVVNPIQYHDLPQRKTD